MSRRKLAFWAAIAVLTLTFVARRRDSEAPPAATKGSVAERLVIESQEPAAIPDSPSRRFLPPPPFIVERFHRAPELARQESAPDADGVVERVRVVEAVGFKYPRIRVVERVKGGDVLSSVEMVAD